MGLEFLADDFWRIALVWAGDRVTAAFGVVRLQRVETEILGAVTASDEPFGALDRLVLHHLLPAHLLAALVVAVNWFQIASPDVTLLKSKRRRKKSLILMVTEPAYPTTFPAGSAR